MLDSWREHCALHVIHISHECALDPNLRCTQREDPHGLAYASFSPAELPGTRLTLTLTSSSGRVSTGDVLVHVWVRLLGTFGQKTSGILITQNGTLFRWRWEWLRGQQHWNEFK